MPSEAERAAVRLDDILQNARLAESFVEGLTFEAFKDDTMRTYAVIRCLEIISEASRRLPDALKARHPSIGWKDLAGVGNVYRHDYDSVSVVFVWRALKERLPGLIAVAAQELDNLDRATGTPPGPD